MKEVEIVANGFVIKVESKEQLENRDELAQELVDVVNKYKAKPKVPVIPEHYGE